MTQLVIWLSRTEIKSNAPAYIDWRDGQVVIAIAGLEIVAGGASAQPAQKPFHWVYTQSARTGANGFNDPAAAS